MVILVTEQKECTFSMSDFKQESTSLLWFQDLIALQDLQYFLAIVDTDCVVHLLRSLALCTGCSEYLVLVSPVALGTNSLVQ